MVARCGLGVALGALERTLTPKVEADLKCTVRLLLLSWADTEAVSSILRRQLARGRGSSKVSTCVEWVECKGHLGVSVSA